MRTNIHLSPSLPYSLSDNTFLVGTGTYLLYYYRAISNAEIDFIVEYQGNYLPLEIKSRNKPVFPARIYNSFKENYNSEAFIVVSRETLKREDDRFFIPVAVLPFIDFDRPKQASST